MSESYPAVERGTPHARRNALSAGAKYISGNSVLTLLKKSMVRQSIRRRIVAITVGLIILMLATSVLAIVMVGRVGYLLDELSTKYSPAGANLTRINTLSFERAIAVRR